MPLALTLRLSFPLRLLRLRPAFPLTAMATPPEHNPKQAGQATPTVEKVKKWDYKELLQWIQQNEPIPLTGNNLENFKEAHIPGQVFLKYAGNAEFFEKKCRLSIGPSETLAGLAAEIMERETAGIKSKLLSFILCTPCRH